MAQVVGQAAVDERDALEVAHRRDDVGDRRVADGHQVERLPVARHVVRQAFVDPQRQTAAEQRAGDDVELEDVGQLVRDQAIERVRRLVDREDHAIAIRFGEGEHAFRKLTGLDVLLLELALGLVEDERNLEGEVVLQVGADLLVCALGVARDALEMLFDLRVVIDLEVVGRVDVPLEIVVPDPVLAEVRDVARLSRRLLDEPAMNRRAERTPHEREGAARLAHAHGSPRKWQRKATAWLRERDDVRTSAAVADVTVAKTVVATLSSPGREPLPQGAAPPGSTPRCRALASVVPSRKARISRRFRAAPFTLSSADTLSVRSRR